MAKAISLAVIIFLLVLLQMHLHCCAAINNDVEGLRFDEASCSSKCSYRCSKASRRKMCLRACNSCCHKCGCVPPGTSGNYDACPCYASLTTHGGRRKCP
ncbi:uncharacterized protein LOC144705670 [Wolffia australiana]